MKLVILEDHADWPIYYISKFVEEGITIERLLLFDNNQKGVKMATSCKNKYEQLGVRVEHVDTLNFLKVAQEFYTNQEIVFLFDVDLEGDRNPLPDKIQIAFANQKIRIDGDVARARFFFYSTFSIPEQYAALQKYFNKRVIDCKKDMMQIAGITSPLESTILLFYDNFEFCSAIGLNP